MNFRKAGIRILGIQDSLGYDAIGITLREYLKILIGMETEKLSYSRTVSCNSLFLDLRIGDMVIVQSDTNMSLAVIEDLYDGEDVSELSPSYEIVAKLDLSSYVHSKRLSLERKEIYEEILEKLSESNKSMLALVDGKIIVTSKSGMSEEILSLIERYNKDFPMEKAFTGRARLNKSSVSSLYDPAYVGRSKVGKAIVDTLKK